MLTASISNQQANRLNRSPWRTTLCSPIDEVLRKLRPFAAVTRSIRDIRFYRRTGYSGL